jgi:uncharacterized protein with PQ loop repeat
VLPWIHLAFHPGQAKAQLEQGQKVSAAEHKLLTGVMGSANILTTNSTIAWSISFYPQPLLNYRRKSTVGATIDFSAANTLGFLFFSISTMLLQYSPIVRQEYAARNPQAPEPTVRLNDVAFAVHAFILCVITLSQFERHVWGFAQDPQRMSRGLLGICIGCAVASMIVVGLALQGVSFLGGKWTWLDWVSCAAASILHCLDFKSQSFPCLVLRFKCLILYFPSGESRIVKRAMYLSHKRRHVPYGPTLFLPCRCF